MGVCKSGIYMWLMLHHLGNYLFYFLLIFVCFSLQMMDIFSDLLYYVITIRLICCCFLCVIFFSLKRS